MSRLPVAVVAAVSSVAFAHIAFAADMPTKAKPIAPPPVVYNWTGFYVGGNIGAAWSRTDSTSNAVDHFGLPGTVLDSDRNSAFLGGGQIGYNWQFAPNWLIGIEGTWVGTDLKTNGTLLPDTRFGGGLQVAVDTKVNQIWTVGGRLGYIWNGNFMTYAAGGFADGHIDATTYDFNGAPLHSGQSSGWHGGWTLGGGAEYMLAPHWIAGVDYKYYDLGDYGHDGTIVGPAPGPPTTFDESIRTHIHSVVFRLSYLFNGP